MRSGRLIPLESGLLALILVAPLAFGSVYSWGFMTLSALIFFLFFFYPKAAYEIKTLPRPFFFGILFIFFWILAQFFFTSLNRYTTGVELLKWLAITSGFLLIQLLPRESLLRMVYCLAAVGVIESLYGLFQVGSTHEKVLWIVKEAHRGYVTGTYLNRNHFAGLLELSLGAQLGLLLQGFERRKIQGIILTAICLGITLLAFFKSGSRTGIASFGASLLFFSPVLFWRKRHLSRGLFLSLVALFVGLAFFEGRQIFLTRFLNFGYDERIFAWQSALRILKQYPFTGTGLGTFEWVFPFFQSEKLSLGWAHAHNDYLELATELGFPVFLIIVSSFGFLWIQCVRLFSQSESSHVVFAWGLLISITSLMLHAFADFNLAIWGNALLFIFVFGILFRSLTLDELQEISHAH